MCTHCTVCMCIVVLYVLPMELWHHPIFDTTIVIDIYIHIVHICMCVSRYGIKWICMYESIVYIQWNTHISTVYIQWNPHTYVCMYVCKYCVHTVESTYVCMDVRTYVCKYCVHTVESIQSQLVYISQTVCLFHSKCSRTLLNRILL